MSSEDDPAKKPMEKIAVKAEPQPMFANAQQRVEMSALPALNAVIRGILSLCIGVPSQLAIIVTAKCAGRIFGMLTAYGDLASVLTIRSECTKAFMEGVAEIKPVMPKAMPADLARTN
jgi:hypothetical protein